MIYKNNEPYKLSAEEVKKHSKRMVYLLMSHYYRWDADDNRMRRPNSILMEPFYTFFEHDQSVEVRYASSAPQKKNEGGTTYEKWNPSQIEFPTSGMLEVPANNPEMNYFLASHPMNDGNEKRDKNVRSVFFAENRAEVARIKMKEQQKKFDAISMIFHDKDGMKEKDLRIVAKSYPDLVGSVDLWTLDQVKDELQKKAVLDANYFLKAARGPETKIKHLVNEAIKEKLIKYAPSKKVWYTMEAEVEKDVIKTVKAGEDPMQMLIEHLANFDRAGIVQFLEKKLEKEPMYQE